MKTTVNDVDFDIPDGDIEKVCEIKDGKIVVKKDGAFSIKSDGHLIFTKEDDEKRIKNLGKPQYEAGKTAALEMKAKEWKEKHPELKDIEGKDLDIMIEKLAEARVAGAKIPANEKITQYEKDLKILRENLQKEADEKTSLKSTYEKEKQSFQVNQHLFSIIPESAINENMDRSDIIALFRAKGYDVVMNEGKFVPTKDGEILKDKSLEPLNPKDVMNQFITDKKLIVIEGGTGDKDKTGGGAVGSYEAFVLEMSKKDIAEGCEAFNREMQSRIKNKTLKV